MGPRHNSNMKAYMHYSTKKQMSIVKQGEIYDCTGMTKFVFPHQGEKQKIFPIRMSEYRLFNGMNPTIKNHGIVFDSDFQCGNLDMVVQVTPSQYDLIMRVDSNTKGHTAWFFFKVTNTSSKQKIKLNIINFSKKYLLFKNGMKPYTFSKSEGKWSQRGIQTKYVKNRFRYEVCDDINSECLSFSFQFESQEEVYFAYCIPYSYSYLLHRLLQFKQKAPNNLKICYENQSTGGLPIPVLEISNFQENGKKMIILCTARLHPGQTQGSWMIDGFIEKLLQPENSYLRNSCVFKIIPMLNVDGVVLGNFRTGIMGRDLNRCFHLENKYSQIDLIRKIAEFKKPSIFIDFHGHSAKKNVFIYGPDYRLQDKNYALCRIFPKLISKQTEAFRYYSCQFQISQDKRTTGRAIMLKDFHVSYAYTVEASSYAYGPMKNQIQFNKREYCSVGFKIAQSLTDFIRFLQILPIKQQLRKNSRNKSNKKINLKKEQSQKSLNLSKDEYNSLSTGQRNLLKEIMKDQVKLNQQCNNNSSEGDSDCQDQANDYSGNDIKKILNNKFNPEIKSNKTERNVKISSKKGKQKKSLSKLKSSSKNIKQKNASLKKVTKSQMLEKPDVMSARRPSHLLEYNDCYIKKKYKEIGQRKFEKQYQDNNNFVNFKWPQKSQNQESTQRFQFGTLEMRNRKYQEKIQAKRFISSRKSNQSIFSIKKSILPMVGRSSDHKDKGQKSMLSEILEEHERKNKISKNLRIIFL